MLKTFWESQKFLIEFTAVFTAIGALFLSIPSPTNQTAQGALSNIQFIWLTIITLSTIVLFARFFLLAYLIAEATREKFRFDIEYVPTGFVLIIAGFFLFNLWRYTIAMYRRPLTDLLVKMSYVVAALLFSLLMYVLSKAKERYRGSRSRYLMTLWGGILTIAGISAAWVEIAQLRFSLGEWLASFAWIAAIYAVFGAVVSMVELWPRKHPDQ